MVHFCEGALSGYAPQDLEDWRGYDWHTLGVQARRVAEAAGARGIWVILGSAHPLSLDRPGALPHNSVYVIDDRGALLDRYDKRFCAGADGEGELALRALHTSIDAARCQCAARSTSQSHGIVAPRWRFFTTASQRARTG